MVFIEIKQKLTIYSSTLRIRFSTWDYKSFITNKPYQKILIGFY